MKQLKTVFANRYRPLYCAYRTRQSWIEGYERVAEMSTRCPDKRLIYVADREGDFYDLLKRAQQLDYPADLLLRAQYNRALGDDLKLWEAIEQ